MFHTSVLSPKIALVNVEYDSKDGRVTKSFKDNSSARSFYLRMSRENRNPKIVKAELK